MKFIDYIEQVRLATIDYLIDNNSFANILKIIDMDIHHSDVYKGFILSKINSKEKISINDELMEFVRKTFKDTSTSNGFSNCKTFTELYDLYIYRENYKYKMEIVDSGVKVKSIELKMILSSRETKDIIINVDDISMSKIFSTDMTKSNLFGTTTFNDITYKCEVGYKMSEDDDLPYMFVNMTPMGEYKNKTYPLYYSDVDFAINELIFNLDNGEVIQYA